MRLLLGSLIVMLFSAPALADQWVITPDGYYVLSLDSDGVPVLEKAVGVTDHVVLGVPIPGPDDPTDPPPPSDDQWGLVAVSATEASKVNDAVTAAKIALIYQGVGELVQDGTIPSRVLKPTLQIAYRSAVGSKSDEWAAWHETTTRAYNDIDFSNPKEAGQGVIDIGLGARAGSSQAAIGDGSILQFIQFFIKTILPLLLDLFDKLSADEIKQVLEQMEAAIE